MAEASWTMSAIRVMRGLVMLGHDRWLESDIRRLQHDGWVLALPSAGAAVHASPHSTCRWHLHHDICVWRCSQFPPTTPGLTGLGCSHPSSDS